MGSRLTRNGQGSSELWIPMSHGTEPKKRKPAYILRVGEENTLSPVRSPPYRNTCGFTEVRGLVCGQHLKLTATLEQQAAELGLACLPGRLTVHVNRTQGWLDLPSTLEPESGQIGSCPSLDLRALLLKCGAINPRLKMLATWRPRRPPAGHRSLSSGFWRGDLHYCSSMLVLL